MAGAGGTGLLVLALHSGIAQALVLLYQKSTAKEPILDHFRPVYLSH